VWLEELTWAEAEPILADDPLLVIPVGAATKEHRRTCRSGPTGSSPTR
jgi:hypothetical protein